VVLELGGADVVRGGVEPDAVLHVNLCHQRPLAAYHLGVNVIIYAPRGVIIFINIYKTSIPFTKYVGFLSPKKSHFIQTCFF
jgi:hypothetical protein